jgi:MFS family permease
LHAPTHFETESPPGWLRGYRARMLAHSRTRLARLRARVRASRRYPWIVLGTVLIGLFATGVSFTILSVFLPTIADDLGSDERTIAWVVTGPILCFGLAGPLLGKLTDVYGARRTYLFGFAAETVAFLFTGLAWSGGSLIAFRVGGALVGATAGPAVTKFIATVFPPQGRSKALGWFSFVIAGAPTLGLLIGSVVVPLVGWRAIFLAQVPLCVLALGFGWFVLDETERQVGSPIDVRGGLLLGSGIFTALLGLTLGGQQGFARWYVLALFVASPVLLGFFVISQLRAPDPLFPLGYFRRRNFSAALAASTLVNFAYLGAFIIAPFLLNRVLGYGAGITAAVLMTRPLLFTVTGPPTGYLVAHFGVRRIGVAGACSILASMLVLAQVSPGTPMWLVIVGLGLAGIGLGMSTPAFNSATINSMHLADQGVGGGLTSSVQSLGAAAGTVVMVTIQTGLEPHGLAVSFHVAHYVAAGVAAVAVVAAALLRDSAIQAPLRPVVRPETAAQAV